MVVDVLTAERKEDVSTSEDKKSEERKKVENESFVTEVKEFVDETKEAITSLFKGDSGILEKSAHDIEENYDTVSEMAKSMVFEKCEKSEEGHEKQEKFLEKSAKSLEEDYAAVADLSKSVVFEKCDKPQTEEQKEEHALEKSADALEETYEFVTNMTESVVFDKCENLTEVEKEEKFFEKVGKDLEDNFEKLSEMTRSTTFEKCEQPLKEDLKEEKASETSSKLEDNTQPTTEDKKEDTFLPKKLDTKIAQEDVTSKVSTSLAKEDSGKSTPDLKETDHIKVDNQDSLLSGISSPGLSGKSSPMLSGRSSPGEKVESKDSLLSGKSTPDHTKPDSKESGKSSPALSAELKEKESQQEGGKVSPDLKLESSSPVGSGKVSPTPGDLKEAKVEVLSSEIKESSTKSSPAKSGKTSPVPSIDDKQKKIDTKESSAKSSPTKSGKSSPVLPIDEKQDVLSVDPKESSSKISPIKSGKSSPVPPVDSKQEKQDVLGVVPKESSGKSSPIKSGKSSPVPKEEKQDVLSVDPKVSSGKASPVQSGKTTPVPPVETKQEKSPVVSRKQSLVESGKVSPVPLDQQLDKMDDQTRSGKSSPAPKLEKSLVESEKGSPIVSRKESLARSGKVSPAPLAQQLDKSDVSVKSGKSSPAPILEKTLTESGKGSPVGSGKTSPVPPHQSQVKEPSAKTSPVGSGKASPALIDVKTTEEAKSGKTSPEPVKPSDVKESVGKVAEIAKEEKELSSGKTSPEVKPAKNDGKITEENDVKETVEKVSEITKEQKEPSSEKVSSDPKPTKDDGKDSEDHNQEVKKSDAKTVKDLSAKAPDILADETIASPEKKTDKEELKQPESVRKISLDVQDSKEKKLSISDVQISMKPEDKILDKSTSDLSKSETPEDSKQLDDKTENKDVDSIDSGIGTEVESKIKKIDEVEKQELKSEAKLVEKKEESIAGPSVILPITSLSPAKTSPEDVNLSGKSTPDIAEVEKMKELQREKHIPGSSTPPTVPVSPITKDPSTEDTKPSSLTPIKSSVISLKDNDLRSCTPASDDFEIGGSTHSDISSGQVSRAPHLLEIERVESDDDDDVPGSPLSVTSQVPHSGSSSRYDFEDERIGTKMDPMNTSFYGALPDEEDPELDFEKALAEHRQTRGGDLVVAADDSPSYLYEVTKAKYSVKTPEPDVTQLDQINKNGADVMTASFMGELPSTTTKDTKGVLDSWGKPLGLPSPAPPNDNRGTPKKERKLPSNVSAKNKLNEKRAESPSKYKNKKICPVYVDLTYVPHHGNSYYSYIDFFKRVRARYYVFSGIEPSREVYNALLEAKQTWEDKELEVTIIPTYDTDILGYWVAENEELLTKYKIDLSPSASRCTINLQDHETSCSAYRLEF